MLNIERRNDTSISNYTCDNTLLYFSLTIEQIPRPTRRLKEADREPDRAGVPGARPSGQIVL